MATLYEGSFGLQVFGDQLHVGRQTPRIAVRGRN